MKIFTLIITTVALMISCNTNKNRATNLGSGDSILYKTLLTDSTNGVPYYQCDEYSAFDTEPSTQNIESKFGNIFQCTKEPTINKHDSTIIDTMFVYRYKNNKIKIYKAVHADLLSLFDVRDSIFEINGKIKTGISKEKFANKFGISNLTPDTFDVGCTEHTYIIRFCFQNNKLTRILHEPYLD